MLRTSADGVGAVEHHLHSVPARGLNRRREGRVVEGVLEERLDRRVVYPVQGSERNQTRWFQVGSAVVSFESTVMPFFEPVKV